MAARGVIDRAGAGSARVGSPSLASRVRTSESVTGSIGCRSGVGTKGRVWAAPRPSRVVNQKVEPCPGVLSTPTAPPII